MSKGQGQKIGIKFTKDLVGDISDNELAFSVEGQEYKYVGGPLIDGDYEIETVERYPISKVWGVNYSNGTLNNVELGDDGLMLGVDD